MAAKTVPSAVIPLFCDHPITFLSKRPKTTVRYKNPSVVRICVISDTYTLFLWVKLAIKNIFSYRFFMIRISGRTTNLAFNLLLSPRAFRLTVYYLPDPLWREKLTVARGNDAECVFRISNSCSLRRSEASNSAIFFSSSVCLDFPFPGKLFSGYNEYSFLIGTVRLVQLPTLWLVLISSSVRSSVLLRSL